MSCDLLFSIIISLLPNLSFHESVVFQLFLCRPLVYVSIMGS